MLNNALFQKKIHAHLGAMQNLLENTATRTFRPINPRILTAVAILLYANSLSRMALQPIGG
ncbi:hypothetical protein AGMMS50248_08290 [Deltaproteobacteria bacterium]|nr:hypothetical protein AGMMS50248_08290 [Deltaproteobacteria bacterium]